MKERIFAYVFWTLFGALSGGLLGALESPLWAFLGCSLWGGGAFYIVSLSEYEGENIASRKAISFAIAISLPLLLTLSFAIRHIARTVTPITAHPASSASTHAFASASASDTYAAELASAKAKLQWTTERRAEFNRLFDKALGKRDSDLKDCDNVGGVRVWAGETVICLKPSAVIWKRYEDFPDYPVSGD